MLFLSLEHASAVRKVGFHKPAHDDARATCYACGAAEERRMPQKAA
jgi:hypothetical protein